MRAIFHKIKADLELDTREGRIRMKCMAFNGLFGLYYAYLFCAKFVRYPSAAIWDWFPYRISFTLLVAISLVGCLLFSLAASITAGGLGAIFGPLIWGKISTFLLERPYDKFKQYGETSMACGMIGAYLGNPIFVILITAGLIEIDYL